MQTTSLRSHRLAEPGSPAARPKPQLLRRRCSVGFDQTDVSETLAHFQDTLVLSPCFLISSLPLRVLWRPGPALTPVQEAASERLKEKSGFFSLDKNGSLAAASAEVRSQEAAAVKCVKLEVGAASGATTAETARAVSHSQRLGCQLTACKCSMIRGILQTENEGNGTLCEIDRQIDR